MLIQFILPALIPLLISIFFGFLLIKIKLPIQLIDYPNVRKIHSIPTPKVGGIIIMITLFFSSILFGLLSDNVLLRYLILCLLFFLIGLLDDLFDWRYRKKLIWQLFGIVIFLIIIPVDTSKIIFSTINLQIPWLNYILIILWILGIVNSFNFFDGINKLAGSLAIIFFINYFLLFYNNSQVLTSEVCIILIFSILGFLLYNRTPAKIFMGDSGSMFLGFLIATLPYVFATKEEVGIDVTYPVIITSILIMEIGYLIFNRIKNGRSPFSPDKNHLHHVLRNLNFKNQTVVLIIVLFTILLSILAYFSHHLVFYQIVIIEVIFFGLLIVLPRSLKPIKKHKAINNTH